jgi:uncharacterized protein (DUF2147 family)
MSIKLLFSFFASILLSNNSFTNTSGSAPVAACEQICGKWKCTEKNLIIQVSRVDNKFKAEIVWFDPGEGKPIETYTDHNNPDESLRSRKVLGINVLKDLSYQSRSNSWEEGIIYDCSTGREWNASVYIDKYGMLRVKGYWHLKFIGKTITFKRV